MRRKIYFVMTAVAIAALVLVLNVAASINKINEVNAATQSSNAVKKEKLAVQNKENSSKPQVKVPFELEVEKIEQKSVDAGHSPWRLDPVFVSQVFVSLKISPQGIKGDYPVKKEELKLVKSTNKDAVVEVHSSKTDIRRLYLERLIKQDSTGIWTVVGYDLGF